MKVKMTLDPKGHADFNAAIKAAGSKALPLLAGALHAEAELVMTEAKLITPVESGTLRDSGHVQAPEISGQTVTIDLGFGGVAEAYALVQHENLTFHHTVGQAKFLETPMLQAASGLESRVAGRIQGKLP